MANKKINQLVSKTSILSTDLFGIGDATTGQLYKKTIAELQAAIGGAVISVNGLVGTVVLDTDDIQELVSPTNKWFTDARARGAISLTVTGSSGASTYNSGTGVLNVPTYTLAGLGGISATFLSGGTGISYNSGTGVISYSGTVYTDSSIRSLLSAGTGISYNSTTGAISYSGTVYTDSSIRALLSLTTTGSSGASTYNSTTGVINVPNYTLAGLGGISLTSLSGGTGITYNSSTGEISYSGTVYTDASVRALISASGAVSYNNTTGVISLTSGNLTEATSSVLTITGGTGAVLGSGTTIQVKQASSTVSGFLSSTDWSTFNNKASALSGTTNYVAKFTSSTGIGNSIIYDNATNIGIANTNPFAGATSLTGIAISDRGGIYKLNVNNGVYVANNLYYDGSDWRRITTNGGTIGLFSSSDGGGFIIASSATGTAGSAATLTDRLTLTSTGNILLNTSTNYNFGNDSNKGIVFNTSSGFAGFLSFRTNNINKGVIYSNDTEMLIYAQANIPLIFGTNDTERLRINADGRVDVKNKFTTGSSISSSYLTYSQHSIDRNNGDAIYLNLEQSGNIVLCSGGGRILMGTQTDNGERLYVNGSIRATGSITANSDITLKKNLLKIENALEKVEQINGYTYELKADDSKRHGGVIAQEIDKVFPEIVNTGNDGLMGVEYGNISALLIEAIKEQQTQIKELKALLNK